MMSSTWRMRALFLRHYWKLAFHLIFKTKHFGVNNLWWSAHPSLLGWSCRQRLVGILLIVPIWRNYQSMVVRSTLGWLPPDDCRALGFSESSQS